MFHHKYNDKTFRGNIYPTRRVSLRNEFPCATSFPAQRVSLRNEFPCGTNFPAQRVSLWNKGPCATSLNTRFPHFRISIFVENSTHLFFANFQRPHPLLNKGENFLATRAIFRMLILC